MSLISITVYHNKGGVGKSTLAQMIAAFLAGVGLRVIILDLDSQAGQSVIWEVLNPEDGTSYETLHMVLKREMNAVNALRYVEPHKLPHFKDFEPGSVALIEGGPQTAETLTDIASHPLKYHRRTEMLLLEVMKGVQDMADVVVMDMGPGDQYMALAALNGTDYLVCPTLNDRDSVERLASVMDEVDAVTESFNPNLTVAAIIPMMGMSYFGGLRISPNVKMGRSVLEAVYSDYLLRDKHGDLLEIPYSEDYARARWEKTNVLADGRLRPATMQALVVMRALAVRFGYELPEVNYAR